MNKADNVFFGVTLPELEPLLAALADTQDILLFHNCPDNSIGEILTVRELKNVISSPEFADSHQYKDIEFDYEPSLEILTPGRKIELLAEAKAFADIKELQDAGIIWPITYEAEGVKWVNPVSPDVIVELAEKIKTFRAKK